MMKLPSLDGGTWVDIFGVVILVRLIGPLFHLPPLNAAEASLWVGTISSFAYYTTNGPRT